MANEKYFRTIEAQRQFAQDGAAGLVLQIDNLMSRVSISHLYRELADLRLSAESLRIILSPDRVDPTYPDRNDVEPMDTRDDESTPH